MELSLTRMMSFIHILPCTSSLISSYFIGCNLFVEIVYLYNPLLVAHHIPLLSKRSLYIDPLNKVPFSVKGFLCIFILKSLSSIQNPGISASMHHTVPLMSAPNHEILLLL